MNKKRNQLFNAVVRGNKYEFRFDGATQSVYQIKRVDLPRDEILRIESYIFPVNATKQEMADIYERELERRELVRKHGINYAF